MGSFSGRTESREPFGKALRNINDTGPVDRAYIRINKIKKYIFIIVLFKNKLGGYFLRILKEQAVIMV